MQKKLSILLSVFLVLVLALILPAAALEPNDPLYQEGKLWYLTDINAPAAWDVTTGNKDLIIAVIDSGLNYDSPEFKDNIWTNTKEIPDNGIDDDKNGYIDDIHGWNFILNSGDITDLVGHGTSVAGIIGAKGNNGVALPGVCWKVKLMPINVCAFTLMNSMSINAVAPAIRYAVDNGAKIINCSFGDMDEAFVHGDILEALKYAEQHGVLVVAAAGNNPNDNDASPKILTSYGDRVTNIIGVSASDKTGGLADFSAFGKNASQVAAPGKDMVLKSIKKEYDTTSVSYQNFVPVKNSESDWEMYTDDGQKIEKDSDVAKSLEELKKNAGEGDNEQMEEFFDAILKYGVILQINGAKSGAVGSTTPITITDDGPVCLSFNAEYYLPADQKSSLKFILTKKPIYSYTSMEQLQKDLAEKNGVFEVDTSKMVSMIDSSIMGSYLGKNEAILGVVAYQADDFRKLYGTDPLYLGVIYSSDSDDGLLKLTSYELLQNFRITEDSYTEPVMFGTSFAAPIVTGVAGLVLSVNPDLSVAQVKECIMSTVDKVPSLENKVTTGGKINAAAAVKKAKTMKGENAKSPFPVLGILAGLGIAGVLVMRRKL